MERWSQGVASLFEDTDPRVRADRWALLALTLIVAGGALARFWGLGNVGLHGDEKTMVLPALHLLRYGTPEMPSGFLYPRAVAQLYLMAESVRAFGVSEWAWRLPSAVCGVLLIVLTWMAGRRFLEPRWNLALTAAVALLPGFIADAQTARMYVFLVTGVTGFMALLFAWERTGRTAFLIAAVIEMGVSMEFHTLSIFGAWLCFFPGLLGGDRRAPQARSRLLWLGAAAFVVIAAEYLALNHWIATEYPHHLATSIPPAVTNAPRAPHVPPFDPLWPLLAALPAIALSWYVVRARGLLPVALLAASLVAQVSRLDHVAILLILAAAVVARRDGKLPLGRLALYLGICALLAAAQVGYLWVHRAGTLSQILGLLLGWPSVRSYIAISHGSLAAVLLAACGVAAGLWRLAHRERAPDYLLLLTLGVWIPLLMIGCFRWDPAWRYVEGQTPPLLLAAFAAAQGAVHAAGRVRAASVGWKSFGMVAAAVVCALVIDPARLGAAVDPTYAHYPDHKGAAEFVESLHPKPADVIVAEDTVMQTYYLGHVDYWLMNEEVAAPFMHEVDGRWVDEYTNTPLLGTGRQLGRLVASRDRGAIYVIGSGENEQDGRKLMRGLGIAQELQSPAFHLIYVGRDGLTDVWKVDAPKHPLMAGREAGLRASIAAAPPPVVPGR